MKSFFVLAVFLVSLYSTSCNNGGGSSKTDCDSIAITKAILDSVQSPMFAGNEKYKQILEIIENMRPKKYFSASINPMPKNVDEVQKMHRAYLDNPLDIYWKDPSSGTDYKVRGFNVPRSDLKTLYENGVKGARIYFGIDPETDEYKLILTSINAKNGNHLVDQEVFDDFFPCPTHCPQDDGDDDEAKQSDLNYWFNTKTKKYEFKLLKE